MVAFTRVKARLDWMPEDFFVQAYTDGTTQPNGHVAVWVDQDMLDIVNNTSPLDRPIVATSEDTRVDTSAAGTSTATLPTRLLDGRRHWLLADWETQLVPTIPLNEGTACTART